MNSFTVREGSDAWELGRAAPPLEAFLRTDPRAPQPPGRVLVPGCGSGYEVRAFHETGHDVRAIEFSAPAVAHAREVLGAALQRSEMRARRLIVEANQLVLSATTQSKAQQLEALSHLVEAHGIVNINRSVFDEAPGFAAGVLSLVQAGLLAVPDRYRA